MKFKVKSLILFWHFTNLERVFLILINFNFLFDNYLHSTFVFNILYFSIFLKFSLHFLFGSFEDTYVGWTVT